MLAKSKIPLPSPKIRKIAHTFQWYGWLSLWVQLGLAFASIMMLLFAASGRKFSSDGSTGIGISIFWSACSFLGLWITTFLAFRYTRIAKGLLREAEAHSPPRKAETIQLLRFAVIVGFIGILLGLLGAGSSLGVVTHTGVPEPATIVGLLAVGGLGLGLKRQKQVS